MLEKKPVSELAGIAKEIRLDCLEMGRHAGKAGAHFGGSFSAAEIFAVLYHHAMNVYPDDPKSPQRDRFILSKGHVALALYSALKTVGIMSKEDLETFKNDGWHAVLRFLFVKEFHEGLVERKECIMYHNYEVGNIVKRKGDEVLMEITSVCYDLFGKERTGYIICSRLDSNIREKLHVDDVEFVSIGNAQSYEFE